MSAQAAAFYGALLDELLAAGVQPLVAIYHCERVCDGGGGWKEGRPTATGGALLDELLAAGVQPLVAIYYCGCHQQCNWLCVRLPPALQRA